MNNNKTFSVSEPLSLDLSIAYMNSLNLVSLTDDRINKILKNIFVKELYFSEMDPIISLSVMMFLDDDPDINNNNALYATSLYIRRFIFNSYGEKEDKEIFDYELVSETPSIVYHNDEYYNYKNLLIDDREELISNLLNSWKKLSIYEQQKWTHMLFISLDYQIIDILISKHQDSFLNAFIYQMDKEYFDFLMSTFFKVFYFINELNNQTPIKNTLALENIYYYNSNTKLNELIISNVSGDVLDIYNDLVDIVKEN